MALEILFLALDGGRKRAVGHRGQSVIGLGAVQPLVLQRHCGTLSLVPQGAATFVLLTSLNPVIHGNQHERVALSIV